MKIYLFIIQLFLITDLLSQTGTNFKITEYGVLNYTESKNTASEVVLKEKPKLDKLPEVHFVKQFMPIEQKFDILVSKKNLITGIGGVRLEILENAFASKPDQKETYVTIHLTEYIDEFDFLNSGIGQIYYNKYGGEQLMTSGGMFKVKFFLDEKEISLEKGKYIEVQFPDFFPKESFSLYYFDEGGVWNLKSSLSKSEKSLVADSSTFGNKQVVGIRIANIEKAGLWNFANTEINNSCLKGNIQRESNFSKYMVIVFPKNSRGYVIKDFNESEFSINSFQNTNVDLLVIQDRNIFGILNSIKVLDKIGSDKKPESKTNFKQDIGKIELKPLTEEDLKDKIKLKFKLGFNISAPIISYKK